MEEKLVSEAQFGLYHAYAKITLKKANELRKNGLIVSDCKDVRNFPRLHRIYWGQAVVITDDVYSLDENSDEYTLGQKLWIITRKNLPKNKPN